MCLFLFQIRDGTSVARAVLAGLNYGLTQGKGAKVNPNHMDMHTTVVRLVNPGGGRGGEGGTGKPKLGLTRAG